MAVSLSSNTTLSIIASVNGLASRLTRSNIKSTLGSVVIRIADMAAVTGPITFLVTTVILESIQTEYNRIQDTISALVWGQHGWCQTTVFYIFAFALASMALRLYLFGGGKRDLKLGIALVALMSLGFIIIAVFPTKAPGALVTLKAIIHRQTARTICSLFPLACLLIASGLRADSNWSKIRLYTFATGGLGSVLFLLGILATVTDASWIGALERVLLVNGLLWCEVMGIWFIFFFFPVPHGG